MTVWSQAKDENGQTPAPRYRDGNSDGSAYEPVPGEDYFVYEEFLTSDAAPLGASSWVIFPDEPELRRFRYEWTLRRNHKPRVPCPESTPLPHKKNTTAERAKYCSLYLRPWVLLRSAASEHVPCLADLDVVPRAPQEKPATRLRLTKKAPSLDVQMRNFHKA